MFKSPSATRQQGDPMSHVPSLNPHFLSLQKVHGTASSGLPRRPSEDLLAGVCFSLLSLSTHPALLCQARPRPEAFTGTPGGQDPVHRYLLFECVGGGHFRKVRARGGSTRPRSSTAPVEGMGLGDSMPSPGSLPDVPPGVRFSPVKWSMSMAERVQAFMRTCERSCWNSWDKKARLSVGLFYWASVLGSVGSD